MGPIISKSQEQSVHVSGSHNILWFADKATSDLSAVFNQTIESAMKRFEMILVANNANIIMIIILAMIIIVAAVIVHSSVRQRCYNFAYQMDSSVRPMDTCNALPPVIKSSSSGTFPGRAGRYSV